MNDNLQLKRLGTVTSVNNGDCQIGFIERKEVMNPSPRGGAYRTIHTAFYTNGSQSRIGSFDSRAEAVEAIVARWNVG